LGVISARSQSVFSGRTLTKISVRRDEFPSIDQISEDAAAPGVETTAAEDSRNKIHNEVLFGGNNFIFCLGKNNFRFFSGSKPISLIVSSFLINVPSLMFYFSTLPRLLEAEELVDGVRPSHLVPITIILHLASLYLMAKTGLSDPGIIPKNYWGTKAALRQISDKYLRLK